MARKTRNEDISGLKLLFIGAVLAGGVFILLSFILGAYSLTTDDPTSLSDIFGLVALLATGAICGFTITKLGREKGLLISILSSLLFVLILLLIGLIMSGGDLPPRCPINYICYMGVSLVTSLVSRATASKKRH